MTSSTSQNTTLTSSTSAAMSSNTLTTASKPQHSTDTTLTSSSKPLSLKSAATFFGTLPSTLYPPPLPKDPKSPTFSTIQEISMLPTSSMSHRNHKSHKNHEDQQKSKQKHISTCSALDKEKDRELSHDEETNKMKMWSNLEPRECRHGQWFL